MWIFHDRYTVRSLYLQAGLTICCTAASFLIAYSFSFTLSISLLFAVITLSLGIGCILLQLWQRHRELKLIKAAEQKVQSFMKGDLFSRIDSCDEGELARFFEEVNHMAMVLHTHMEKEKKSNEFLQRIISDISHQIKTPLAALSMYLEIMLIEKEDPSSIADYCTKCELSINRMDYLVQNLLKIAKFDAGIIQFEMANVSVREVLIQVVEEFDTRCKREGKSIELIDNGEVILHCDSIWMTEAISNIVKNALDHMNAGGSVTLSYMETPVFIRIKIIDLGEGIHPEDLHNIFKRFYRSRFSKDTQGAGLGLPLANMITEAHSGTITVESELGRGSSFQLDFMKESRTMQGIRKYLTKV